MDPIADDTIGGYNRFLADQRELAGATFTLVLFNDKVRVELSRVPVGQVSELSHGTYVPNGSTALLDAVGTSIIETAQQLDALPETERPDKVIFVILTDGAENSSRHYTRQQVFELIERRRAQGWQFVFLGAEQDAIQEAEALGIDANSALTFEHSGAGTTAAFGSASTLVQSFSSLENPKSKPSFSDADREAQRKLHREQRFQRPSKN
jgi:hypothetical protein